MYCVLYAKYRKQTKRDCLLLSGEGTELLPTAPSYLGCPLLWPTAHDIKFTILTTVNIVKCTAV